MANNKLKKVLEAFHRAVISKAKQNLAKDKNNDTGKLSNSMVGEVEVSDDGVIMTISMEEYGEFLDKGISGKDKKYNTPFSFNNKQPDSRPLAKWAKRKGMRLEGYDGVMGNAQYNTLGFLIARGIFRGGRKPSLFFTKPFEEEVAQLPDIVLEATGQDIEDLIRGIIK